MRAYRTVLAIVVLAAVSANPVRSADTDKLPPLPDSLRVGGKTYRVVQRDTVPRGLKSSLPEAYRFGAEQQPIRLLDEDLQFWLEGDRFLRSPDGKFALPFRGSAPFVGIIDLENRQFIPFGDVFPPTGEKRGKGGQTRYEWTGLLDRRQDKPAQLWLFVRRWNRSKRSYASHRVSIPLADPRRISVQSMNNVAVDRVYTQAGDEMLCEIADSRGRNWARISMQSWTILAKGKPAGGYGHLGRAVYTPDRREIYVAYSSGGLVIFDAADGTEKTRFAKAGKFANAFTLGATFDPGGSVAVVSTPYWNKVTLIDVQARRILAEYKTPVPLAGLSFDDRKLEAYAYETFLPYE